MRYLLTFKEFYSKGNLLFGSLWEKISSDMSYNKKIINAYEHEINSDFKSNKSWKEYETKVSHSFGIEKVIRGKDVYIGDTPKGKGKIFFSDGEIYKGQTVSGIIHGFGKYWYKDGSVYIGEFVRGKKNGIGMIVYGDKHYCKGHWKDDRMCGKGTWKKGTKKFSIFNTMKGLISDNIIGIFAECIL